MKNVGIYIHIPFCKKKCNYCDFISFCNSDNLIEDYISSILSEIDEVGDNCKDSNIEISTIYIGGGTPSYIDSIYIEKILAEIRGNFILKENIEITIEINPGTVDIEKLLTYKKVGINRLSIGMQSTDNSTLNMLGRIHTYEDFENSFSLARKVGFNNINIDVMIGLPNQTTNSINIEKIVHLNPEHISVYSLILEEKTKLFKDVNSGKLVLPNEEDERKMYWFIKNELENNGYKHYEISNFSKPNLESKHNLDCWNQKEYFGFGVASHSFVDNVRFSNTENICDYIENYKKGEQEKNFVFHEKLDYLGKMKEYMMLGFRKLEGINKQAFINEFKIDIYRIFREEIETLKKEDLIFENKTNIFLSNKGLDLANIVFGKFI